MKFKNLKKPYFIAEVGQNHNGSMENALEFVKRFALAGANAVKFQTRDNKYLFSESKYFEPYSSENAFASTYGEHREFLELDVKELFKLRDECRKYQVDFMSTPFDEPSLNRLIDLDVDIIKIASFDLGNLPFINRIGHTLKPVVLSVGGGNVVQIKSTIDTLLRHHDDIAVLHCVSEYPTEYNRMGLNNITELKKLFPTLTIGSSDHYNGILSGPVARMMGAEVFEKHVTLNRAWKGTDQSFALEAEGFRKFVRDVDRTLDMLVQKPAELIGKEPVFKKLGKSLVASKPLVKGDILSLDNLSGKIFTEQIIPVRQSNEVIGKKVLRDFTAFEPIKFEDLE